MDFDELNDAMAKSNARARWGRSAAWLIFAISAALPGLVAFLALVGSPCGGFMCPMYVPISGPITGETLMALGFAGFGIGLLWMWRIVRADPEPDSRSWRYRHRR